MSKNRYSPKCPTCKGVMWMDYESGSWGKDYYWKCSKKKQHNPSCPNKERHWECDKCERVSFECSCGKDVQ